MWQIAQIEEIYDVSGRTFSCQVDKMLFFQLLSATTDCTLDTIDVLECTKLTIEYDGDSISRTQLGNFSYAESLAEVIITPTSTFTNVSIGSFSILKSVETVTFQSSEATPCSVRYIEDYAFSSMPKLTKIIFESPSKLETIGEYCFYQCNKLDDVILPASVNCISSTAFAFCLSLKNLEVDSANTNYCTDDNVLFKLSNGLKTEIICYPSNSKTSKYTVPNTVEIIHNRSFAHSQTIIEVAFQSSSQLKEIRSYAFTSCFNLRQIAFPKTEHQVTISDGAFSSCFSLTNVIFDPDFQCKTIPINCFKSSNVISINFNSHVTEILSGAFTDCTSLQTVNTTNLETLGSNVFTRCQSMREIYLPKTLKTVGRNCFAQCTRIRSLYFDSDCPLTVIPEGCFTDVVRLPKLNLPSHIESIEANAFDGCSTLKNVTFKEDTPLTVIQTSSFPGCTSLTVLHIPKNTKEFQKTVDILSLKEFDVHAENPYLVNDDQGVLFTKDKKTLLCFPPSNSATEYKVPDSVTKIAKGAFSQAQSLTSISLGKVEEIEEGAFESCHFLSSIEIPESVASIGVSCFHDCIRLKSVHFTSKKITVIPSFCFEGCPSLRRIAIPDSVEEIGEKAFDQCNDVSEVYLSEKSSLVKIDNFAFGHMRSLEYFFIPSKVDSISSTAFEGIDFKFLEFRVSKDNEVFTAVSGILMNKDKTTLIQCPPGYNDKEFRMPESVTEIQQSAFAYCRGFTAIHLGKVKTIGEYAFYACTWLLQITIPDRVTTIGAHAFEGCYRLEFVNFSENSQLSKLGEFVYSDCSALREIYIPENVTNGINIAIIDSEEQLNIERFVVHPNNKKYTAVDGVLYSSRGMILVCYPQGKTDEEFTVPNTVFMINQGAFKSARNLRTIKFESGSKLATVGDDSFSNLNLTECILPESTNTIGKRAFKGTHVDYIGELLGLEGVNEEAFADSTISRFTVGKKVANIATTAFDGADQIKIIEVDPSNQLYSSLDCDALYDKSTNTLIKYPNLHERKYLRIPEFVEKISNKALQNCKNLKAINFDENCPVSKLLPDTFSGCDSLETISIPFKLDVVNHAFDGIPNLKTINTQNNLRFSFRDKALFNGQQTIIYKYMVGSDAESFTIPNGIISLAHGCFMDAKKLKIVNFSNNNAGLTKIPTNCFLHCYNLEEIVLPSSVDEIGNYAFSECVNLRKIEFSENSMLHSFGASCFENCESLESITIPSAVMTLPISLFAGCESLRQITFQSDSTLISIGRLAFSGCPITEFHVTKHVTAIDDYAFLDCTSLVNVTFSNRSDLNQLGKHVFKGCSSLHSLTLPAKLQSFSSGFIGCSQLTNLEIKSNDRYVSESNQIFLKLNHGIVSRIGVEKVAEIPKDATEVESYAYSHDPNLVEVKSGNSKVEAIFDNAFSHCPNLTYFEIGPKVYRIDKGAFTNTPINTIMLTNVSELRSLNGFYSSNSLQKILVPKGQLKNLDINTLLRPFGNRKITVEEKNSGGLDAWMWALIGVGIGVVVIGVTIVLIVVLRLRYKKMMTEKMSSTIVDSLIT